VTGVALLLAGWLVAAGLAVALGLAARRARSRAELAARACHELRGPLTAAELALHGSAAAACRRARAGGARAGARGARRPRGGADGGVAPSGTRTWTSAPCSPGTGRRGRRRPRRPAPASSWAARRATARAVVPGDASHRAGVANLVANAAEHAGGRVRVAVRARCTVLSRFATTSGTARARRAARPAPACPAASARAGAIVGRHRGAPRRPPWPPRPRPRAPGSLLELPAAPGAAPRPRPGGSRRAAPPSGDPARERGPRAPEADDPGRRALVLTALGRPARRDGRRGRHGPRAGPARPARPRRPRPRHPRSGAGGRALGARGSPSATSRPATRPPARTPRRRRSRDCGRVPIWRPGRT
jgi:translation initiation factor IF-2